MLKKKSRSLSNSKPLRTALSRSFLLVMEKAWRCSTRVETKPRLWASTLSKEGRLCAREGGEGLVFDMVLEPSGSVGGQHLSHKLLSVLVGDQTPNKQCARGHAKAIVPPHLYFGSPEGDPHNSRAARPRSQPAPVYQPSDGAEACPFGESIVFQILPEGNQQLAGQGHDANAP